VGASNLFVQLSVALPLPLIDTVKHNSLNTDCATRPTAQSAGTTPLDKIVFSAVLIVTIDWVLFERIQILLPNLHHTDTCARYGSVGLVDLPQHASPDRAVATMMASYLLVTRETRLRLYTFWNRRDKLLHYVTLSFGTMKER
jgi:hypothetical protein